MTQKELLQLIGRELFPDWKMTRVSGGLLFSKSFHDRTRDVILISTPTTGNGYRIGSYLSGQRALLDVEDILAGFYRKHCPDSPLQTIIKDVPVGKAISFNPIESASDLAPLLPPMRELVFDQMLPFLNRFNTIEAVYAHAKDMDHDQRALFVHSPVVYRMLILKRLVNAPDFLEYGDQVTDYYKQMPRFDTKGFISELYDHLKKM